MRIRALCIALTLAATPACTGDGAALLKSIFPGGEADTPAGAAGASSTATGQLVARLQQCGLLTTGNLADINIDIGATRNDALTCLIQCAIGLSCEEIESFVCGDLQNISPGFLQCFEDCSFTCDGGETTVSPFQACDGEPECEDGADEVGCPGFVCDDGEVLPPEFECDGFADCLDGSDEADCPTFACGDGTVIPQVWVCDFEEDCEDGSDEAGCAELICTPDQTPTSDGPTL